MCGTGAISSYRNHLGNKVKIGRLSYFPVILTGGKHEALSFWHLRKPRW